MNTDRTQLDESLIGPIERSKDFDLRYRLFAMDEENKVLHAELVGEIGDEPDYDAAIAALG